MKYPVQLARWLSLVLIVIVLVTAWLPRGAVQAGQAPLDGALGPQLVRIKATPAQQAELAAAGLVAHTRLADGSVLASGPAAAVATARAAGFALDLLAADTRGQVYYLVDAQATQAASLAARLGRILYQDAGELLVAVPAAAERVGGGTMSPNGNSVSLEGEMVKAADVKREHDLALAIYGKSLAILRASLGRR